MKSVTIVLFPMSFSNELVTIDSHDS